jgi:hypothetical protein
MGPPERGPAARKREVALHQSPSTEQGLLGPHCDGCSVRPALWHSLEGSGERERYETTVTSKESRSTTGERPTTAASPAQSTGPRAPARPSARHRPHSTRSRTESQRAAKSSHVQSPGLAPRMLADLILHRRVRSEAAAGGRAQGRSPCGGHLGDRPRPPSPSPRSSRPGCPSSPLPLTPICTVCREDALPGGRRRPRYLPPDCPVDLQARQALHPPL